MFLRLKNVIDYEMLKPEIDLMMADDTASSRVLEILTVLDESYGANRLSRDMGGYVLLFDSEELYSNYVSRILGLNGFDTDMYEYSDVIGSNSNVHWKEELYLLTSEDSITMIHPVDRGDKNE